MSWWGKVDCNLDLNPKARKAGWIGVSVFDRLLRLNGRVDGDGTIPRSYCDPEYLSEVWKTDSETVKHGIVSCVDAGLIEMDEGGNIVIVGWDEEWKPVTTSTERVQAFRDRQRSRARNRCEVVNSETFHETDETKCNEVKRNETNVTPIDQTRPDQNNTSNGDEQQPPSAAGAAGFDFESIYREYPRHKGKTRGLKHCKARIKTSLQFDRLKSAVATYAAECRLKGTEEDYIKQFDTFMGCWQDFVPPTVLPSDGNGSTHSTIADPLVREIVERDARRKAEYDKDPEGYMQRKLAALRDGTL